MSETSKELIRKFKRNSKLGKIDSEQLQGELFDMLVEQGISDEVVETLLEGPVELMMTTFSQYVVNVQNGKSLFQGFLHNKRVQENKSGVSGQKMVYLLNSFLLMQEPPSYYVEKTFLALLSYSKRNNIEEYNRKVVELVKNTFMTGENTLLTKINLSFINKDKTWIKAREFMMFCAFDCNKATVTLKQEIYTWLANRGLDMGRYTKDVVESLQTETGNQEESNNNKNQQDEEKETKYSSAGTSIDSQKSDIYEKDDELYVFLKTVVQCIGKQSQSIKSLKHEIDALSKRTDEYMHIIEEDKVQLMDRQKRIMELNSAVRQLTSDLEKQRNLDVVLQNKIAELEKEVSDRTQFAATVAKNRQMQSQEGLNKLASSLRLDYGDFCDAKDLEMSIDLGENMRAQLESVFSILKKHGIKLD